MYKQLMSLLIALLVLSGCVGGWGSAGTLKYNGPTEQSVAIGQTVPGADIRYMSYSERGAEVSIGGQTALKKVGDSLDWRGAPVSGVDVAISQRILLINAQRLQTVGTVNLTVRDAAPAAAQFPDKPVYSYKVAVTYNVKRGATIPGTLITYKGKNENGAELGGVSGYPYRKLGDSISWSGSLRGNTYLDMTVRVLAYTDDMLQAGGLATIGLTE